MARKAPLPSPKPAATRRQFTEEFRRDAVQMLLDGHTATSIAQRLGLSCPTLLYRWKANQLHRSGPSPRRSRIASANSKPNCSASPASATC